MCVVFLALLLAPYIPSWLDLKLGDRPRNLLIRFPIKNAFYSSLSKTEISFIGKLSKSSAKILIQPLYNSSCHPPGKVFSCTLDSNIFCFNPTEKFQMKKLRKMYAEYLKGIYFYISFTLHVYIQLSSKKYNRFQNTISNMYLIIENIINKHKCGQKVAKEDVSM